MTAEDRWIERATELAAAANRCLRASTECLRLAEQARLTAERESPFAGSRDPGALPGVLGSRSLQLEYPHLWTIHNEWNTSELRDIRIVGHE